MSQAITRRFLRRQIEILVEYTTDALNEALDANARAKAMLAKLDEDASAGKIPTPHSGFERTLRMVRMSAQVDAALMVAYYAETGTEP